MPQRTPEPSRINVGSIPALPLGEGSRERPIQMGNPWQYLLQNIRRTTPFNVEFVRRTDGARRHMLARLWQPPYTRRSNRGPRNWNPEDYGLIPVWDLQNSDYRFIPGSNITAINHAGIQVRRNAKSRPVQPVEESTFARDARNPNKYYPVGYGPDDVSRPTPVRPFDLKGESGESGVESYRAFKRAGGLKGNRMRPKDFDVRADFREANGAVVKFERGLSNDALMQLLMMQMQQSRAMDGDAPRQEFARRPNQIEGETRNLPIDRPTGPLGSILAAPKTNTPDDEPLEIIDNPLPEKSATPLAGGKPFAIPGMEDRYIAHLKANLGQRRKKLKQDIGKAFRVVDESGMPISGSVLSRRKTQAPDTREAQTEEIGKLLRFRRLARRLRGGIRPLEQQFDRENTNVDESGFRPITIPATREPQWNNAAYVEPPKQRGRLSLAGPDLAEQIAAGNRPLRRRSRIGQINTAPRPVLPIQRILGGIPSDDIEREGAIDQSIEPSSPMRRIARRSPSGQRRYSPVSPSNPLMAIASRIPANSSFSPGRMRLNNMRRISRIRRFEDPSMDAEQEFGAIDRGTMRLGESARGPQMGNVDPFASLVGGITENIAGAPGRTYRRGKQWIDRVNAGTDEALGAMGVQPDTAAKLRRAAMLADATIIPGPLMTLGLAGGARLMRRIRNSRQPQQRMQMGAMPA